MAKDRASDGPSLKLKHSTNKDLDQATKPSS